MLRILYFGVLLVVVAISSVVTDSSIDPDDSFVWSENIGWTNWQHDTPNPGDGIFVGDSFLAGFVWAENVGWINLGDGTPNDGVHYVNTDASEFGVNIDPETGNLFGLAWGENVGWINFDTAIMGDDRARFEECEHRFFGYAWAENVGWINLNDATHCVAVGPCEVGDVDCDGSVRLDDYSRLQSKLAGPDTPASCSALDADDDGDLDLRDVAAFQIVFGNVR